MKKIGILLIGIAIGSLMSAGNGIHSDIQGDNLGETQATIEALFVPQKAAHVDTILTSESGLWQIDVNGCGHFKYLILEPQSLSSLPTTDGVFAIIDDPIRITAVDSGGTRRYSEMIPEDETQLYSGLVLDLAYRHDGQWWYGDSVDLID